MLAVFISAPIVDYLGMQTLDLGIYFLKYLMFCKDSLDSPKCLNGGGGSISCNPECHVWLLFNWVGAQYQCYQLVNSCPNSQGSGWRLLIQWVME